MFKPASVAALLAGAILLSPANPAFAVTTESSTDAGAGANVADPDDQIDATVNPDGGTAGSATIDQPAINLPTDSLDTPGESDSDDYTPPDSEDDSEDVPPDSAPSDDTSN